MYKAKHTHTIWNHTRWIIIRPLRDKPTECDARKPLSPRPPPQSHFTWRGAAYTNFHTVPLSIHFVYKHRRILFVVFFAHHLSTSKYIHVFSTYTYYNNQIYHTHPRSAIANLYEMRAVVCVCLYIPARQWAADSTRSPLAIAPRTRAYQRRERARPRASSPPNHMYILRMRVRVCVCIFFGQTNTVLHIFPKCFIKMRVKTSLRKIAAAWARSRGGVIFGFGTLN